MRIENIIASAVYRFFSERSLPEPDEALIQLQKTRKEFDGDITLVAFPLAGLLKKPPSQAAEEIGAYLVQLTQIADYNVVKGFLNLVIESSYWTGFVNENAMIADYGISKKTASGETILVEYSSPNTNKPLHLGHIRNNLLGFSISRILEANGKNVSKVNLVNDRGIHICKTMLAWEKWGENKTPADSGLKGDHFVGDMYVRFENALKKEVEGLVSSGMAEDDARREAPLMKEAQNMLRKWEEGDGEVYALWKKMNDWVYEGFDVTYEKLGVSFDRIYYESETYHKGKEIVEEGLRRNILKRNDDGSVWADLTHRGLDRKLLLRSDGTSVYMTQDLGTAVLRQKDFGAERMLYVVGNEQDYHFRVLSLVLEELGYEWAGSLQHISYGMVELPSGKMKSREGKVVDADNLIDEMVDTAGKLSAELGKLDGLSGMERQRIINTIGMGALKYFILKVDPKKNMVFNPEESIDFNGNTGPFIQYTYARICSLLRKAGEREVSSGNVDFSELSLSRKETGLVSLLHEFPSVIEEAGNSFSPALIANLIYEIAREYNQFYQDHPVIREPNESLRQFRLLMSEMTGNIIKSGMGLLGIDVPEKM